MSAELPPDEKKRLRILQSYRVLDTPPEQAFDDFTLLASHICDTPIALVSLIDETREWFKSKVGVVDVFSFPRDVSFSAHAILDPNWPFVVPDAAQDPRFSANPLVTGDPHIRFYAGIPLVSPEGLPLGTLCVIDREPRTLKLEQIECLKAIARQVIQQLILRRSMKEQLQAVMRLQEAQAALTQAENLMENASDIVQSTDVEGRVDYVNLAWCRTMGYSPTEAMGLSVFEIIHSGSRPHFQDMFNRVLKGEPIGSVSTVFVGKDGREIPVEGIMNAKGSEGKPRSIRGIFRDITARRKEEVKRREAEERYTALFNESSEGIVQFDVKGTLIAANPAMAQMLGYPSAEELIRCLNETDQPLYVNERDRINLVRTMVRRGTAQGFECQLIRKDGGVIWVRGSGRAVRDPDDKLRYFEGIIIDLTDRKLVELERDRYFSLSQNFFCIADFDGYFKKLNPAWENLGYKIEDLLSRPFIDFVHPDDREATITEVQGIHTGKESINFENRYRCWDGSYRWLLWNAAPSAEQRVIYASARDITEIKAFEQELKRNNLELESRNRRIEEASRLKSEFLANMSHELRTPLNGIIGFSELMYNEDVGPLSPDHKEFVGDILASGRHLLQLINDILDLSKVEAGKLEMRPEETDLTRLIQEVCDITRTLASKKNIEIKVSVDPLVRDVFLDSGKLKQVLYNYLSNALKFTPERGKVHIVATAEGNGEFRLEVQDSGIGIDEKDMPKLFVEFQQLDGGASKKYQGTGLGLALTRKIVEAQFGRVGVTSKVGHGSTFFAILPVRMPGASPVAADFVAPAGVRPESSARVLVVDDDPALLKLMSTTLRSLGYEPVCTSDGVEGLAAVDEMKPDAIVLDLLMPKMGGLEFLERLRAHPPNRSIPVIVWTNQDLTSHERSQLSALSQGLIPKGHGDIARLLEELKASLMPGQGPRKVLGEIR
jgi:PAS domain S-box-containing protein